MTWTKTGNIRGPTGATGPQGPTGPTGPQGPQGPTGSGILPADTTIAVGTRIISNKLVSTDANPVWQVMGDGRMNFGAGGASVIDAILMRQQAGALRFNATHLFVDGQIVVDWDSNGDKMWFSGAYDTNLYRSAASVLKTDGYFVSLLGVEGWGASTSGESFVAKVVGDTNPRLYIQAGGTLQWGPGNAVVDTNLYRSNANQLKTDSGFYAVGPSGFHWNGSTWVIQTITSPGLGLYFGSDTNLYRRSAGVLQTDGGFYANTTSGYIGMLQPGDAALRWSVDFNGKLQWGPGNAAGDVSLYRNSAGVLNMNGSIYMGTGQAVGGAFAGMAASGDIYSRVDMTNNGLIRFSPGNAAQDVTVHRYNANQLGTYGDLVLGSGGSGRGALYCNYTAGATNQVWVGQYGGSVPFAGITFGGDTYLYRTSAGALRTDGNIAAGGGGVQGTTVEASQANPSFGLTDTGQTAPAGRFQIYSTADSVRIWRQNVGDIVIFSNIGNITAPSVTIGNFGVGPQVPGNDFNNATSNGWYCAQPGTANSPKGISQYWAVQVINITYTGACRQIAYQHGGQAVFQRYENGAGTWSSWWQVSPSYYGTAPQINPVDGEEWVLSDTTGSPAYTWKMRYNINNSSGYPWEFVGGSPMLQAVGPTGTCTTSTYGYLGDGLTAPRAGLYQFVLEATMDNTGQGQQMWCCLYNSTGGGVSDNTACTNRNADWTDCSKTFNMLCVAGEVIHYAARTTSSGGRVIRSSMKMTPVRVN